MGLLSKFEGKVEDTVEGAAEKIGAAQISPVQIAKKAERQMRKEKMVGAGKQYAPTLYTVLVSQDDDSRLFGYYPTLAGETETYLSAKATEEGLAMDGQPLVRFIADENLKSGKFDVIAEMVAAPIIEQLREEEMEHYGISPSNRGNNAGNQGNFVPLTNASQADAYDPRFDDEEYLSNDDDYDNYDDNYDNYDNDYADRAQAEPPYQQNTASDRSSSYSSNQVEDIYLYDITNDRAFTLDGHPMTIGRESKCDIEIPDINASRSHAEIRQDASGAWILSDLNSTNGTFVNGRKIKSIPLRDADRIVIGTTDLEFQIL